MVERLFLAVPRGCLQFVIVVFPDHTHLLFFLSLCIFQHPILEKTRHINLLPLARINFVQKANSVAPCSPRGGGSFEQDVFGYYFKVLY